jgi:hypothetical protein
MYVSNTLLRSSSAGDNIVDRTRTIFKCITMKIPSSKKAGSFQDSVNFTVCLVTPILMRCIHSFDGNIILYVTSLTSLAILCYQTRKGRSSFGHAPELSWNVKYPLSLNVKYGCNISRLYLINVPLLVAAHGLGKADGARIADLDWNVLKYVETANNDGRKR